MTTMSETSMCQSNVFVMDADGFKVHFQLNAPWGEIMSHTNGLLIALKEQKYKPDTSMERGRRVGHGLGADSRTGNGAKNVEVKCGECGGPVWDNRKENDERGLEGKKRRPDFACKNKDTCKWICWNGGDLIDEIEREALPVGSYDPEALPFE